MIAICTYIMERVYTGEGRLIVVEVVDTYDLAVHGKDQVPDSMRSVKGLVPECVRDGRKDGI